MTKVILKDTHGKLASGNLTQLQNPNNVKVPAALVAAMGSGSFYPGEITVSGSTLHALYSVESEANEKDFEERQLHQEWMKAKKLQPGHVIGYAIDGNGKLYQFQSA